MAVGDLLCSAFTPVPPATNAASLEFRAGGSTDNESFPVWAFDASSSEKLDLHGAMTPRYVGANLKVRVPVIAASATTGNVGLAAAFRRIDTAEDVDASHSYSEQAATIAVSGTNGCPTYIEIAFTAAQIDGIVAGESFVLRLRRDVTVGSNAAGDAQVLVFGIQIIET